MTIDMDTQNAIQLTTTANNCFAITPLQGAFRTASFGEKLDQNYSPENNVAVKADLKLFSPN